MNARHFSREFDWPALHCFWIAKGLPPVPDDFLPPTGLVVDREDGTLLCGGFLVKSDTKAASLAFLSANPDVSKEERSEALDLLVGSLVWLAQEAGFTHVCVSTNVPALQKRYEGLGFERTDENVVCYGGRV